MNIDKNYSSPSQLSTDELPPMTAIVGEIRAIADRSTNDPIALLHLLRTLEELHHQIQESYFQPALPDSRHALYSFLRDIEENGGWPYIQRPKLQALFANIEAVENGQLTEDSEQ